MDCVRTAELTAGLCLLRGLLVRPAHDRHELAVADDRTEQTGGQNRTGQDRTGDGGERTEEGELTHSTSPALRQLSSSRRRIAPYSGSSNVSSSSASTSLSTWPVRRASLRWISAESSAASKSPPHWATICCVARSRSSRSRCSSTRVVRLVGASSGANVLQYSYSTVTVE